MARILRIENKTKNTSSISSHSTFIVLLPSLDGRTIFGHDFLHPFAFHTIDITTQITPITQNFSGFDHLLQSMANLIPLSVLFAGIILVLMVGLFFISFGFNVIFYSGIMPWIIHPVSKLCTYYKTKSESNPFGETFERKVRHMYVTYLVLTIPLLLTMVYIINPSTIAPNTNWGFSGFNICIVVAFLSIPGFLLLLRLMANPTNKGKSYLSKQLLIKRKFVGSDEEIKKVKENISSFLGALIFLTALFLFLQFCADYLSSSGSYSTFFERYRSTMPLWELVIWIAVYFEGLYIVTRYGESILEECDPIMQEDAPIIQKTLSDF